MSTFTTYNTLIEQRLANTSETFFTPEMKRSQTNQAILDITKKYDLPEFMVDDTLTLTSGLVDIPADFLRMVKVWSVDGNGIEDQEYMYIPPEEFDNLETTAAYYWTILYKEASSSRRIEIRPTSVTSLKFRYVTLPTTMSNDSTDSGLSALWDEPVALFACHRLLRNAGVYDEAQVVLQEAQELIASAYLAVKNEGGFRAGRRFRSIYERRSLYNR